MSLVKNDVTILSIESSCDDTSVAVVKNGREVLSNVISSQINTHRKFGGVVPEVASRKHIENIDIVLNEALKIANIDDFSKIDAIAVTSGPGLVGSLLVGISYAKTISFAKNIPLISVHHIAGHISANYIEQKNWKPPFICLVVSGSHTHLVHVKDYTHFEILGKTRDDACGEAFDKIARAIGLPYPGGPEIDKLAKIGDKNAINFPRVMLDSQDYDFSFSGLKSACLNYINKCKMSNTTFQNCDLAASFQQAIVDVLVFKAIKACKDTGINKLSIAGGVSANSYLRETIKSACLKENIELCMPSLSLCTDNAAMIGAYAYFKYLKRDFSDLYLNAYPNLKLDEL